jgi:hypothetical protein
MHNPPSEENPEGNSGNSYRSINLSKIDGVYCKSGNNTRRYIGTIRTTTSYFLDNETNRLVYNFYNRVKKIIRSDINQVNDPYFTFSWIYPTNIIRKIPYIPEISVINGLDSNIDLKVLLEVAIPYNRSEYFLGIIRSGEIYYHSPSASYGDILEYIDTENFDYYEPIVLSNTTGIVTTDIFGGDYQDGVSKILSASIYCSPVGYETYYAIEKSALGSPVVYGNKVIGTYGIMGTYEC